MEEEDVDWFEVLQPCAIRRAPRWDAAACGELRPGQRIQVSSERKGHWARLTMLEMWLSSTEKKKQGFVLLQEPAGQMLRGPLAANEQPGGDWEQMAALLRWWPLAGTPPLQPAVFGGAWLCHWKSAEVESIQATWLLQGEELELVGPEGTKAGDICRWLAADIGLGTEHDVVLVQDLPGLDACGALLEHTDMKTVGPRQFCALARARPRLHVALETSVAQKAQENGWALRAFCAVDRPMPSVFNGQIPERVLAPFEALSQLLEHSGACAVALLPADLPLKEAAAEALALTPCARSRCRLSSPSLKDDALSTALASLQSFGAVQRFEIMGLRSPLLYLAQDEMGPVLGILTTKDEGGDEPPPLAAGLKVSLQGLSGCTTVISAGRQWTVGELKDAAALPRHQSRLLQGSASLRDEQLLGDLLPEAQEELLLRLLRLDPRWAEAMEEVKVNALAWQSLPQDLKDDRDLTLAAVTQEPHLLGQSAFLADAELVLAAANKDSAVLQLASPELWEESFSLRAVACSARAALPFAQLSRQVAQAAVRQDPLSLGLLPPPLQEEVLEAALDAEPMALQFAPEALRDDAALLRRLVAKNGRALRFASARLRNSRDLVLLAIASHPAAVFSASEELLTDKEVLLAAMERDPKLVHQLAHYARRIA